MRKDETVEALRHYTNLLELLHEVASANGVYELQVDLAEMLDHLGVDVRDTAARRNVRHLLEGLAFPVSFGDGHWTSHSTLLTMRWSEFLTPEGVAAGTVQLRFSAPVVDSYRAWRDLRSFLDGRLYRSIEDPLSRKLLLILYEGSHEDGGGYLDLDELRDLLPLSPQLSDAEVEGLLEAAFEDLTVRGILKHNPLKQPVTPQSMEKGMGQEPRKPSRGEKDA